MLALRGVLQRACNAPRQCQRASKPPACFASVLRSSGAWLHSPPPRSRDVIPLVPSTTRAFSSLLGNGVAPRRPAPVAASEPVIALPPAYELLLDDVHCFVGLNGSGKTRFLAKLQQHVESQQRRGELPASCRLASLSLDAHREFVVENGHRVVADVLGGIGSPTARDLIVRLGLFPVWEQRVRHLSTGEMRKLLLAVALLETPRATVLILDQPFDGLDVKARRQLQWMLGQLTRGFTRLLVETTGAKHEAFAYKTQVLLVANRLEQVFPEIFSHTVLLKQGDDGEEEGLEVVAWPEDKEDDMRNKAMMKRLEDFYGEEHEKRARMTDTELVSLVEELFDSKGGAEIDSTETPAVRLDGVSISYDQKRILLDNVDFARQTHEHWVLLGPNGSGKSSLMRVLMQTPGHGLTEGEVVVVGEQVRPLGSNEDSTATSKPRMEAISTDQHIQLLHKNLQHDGAEKDQTAFSLIANNAVSPEAAKLAKCLLALPDAVEKRSLSELSQGEQKLVLIARALAARPKLLILDEITHGLDPFNRAHVLRVIEAIGQQAAQQTHMVLITHHEDEITPCFSSIFEIKGKQLVERPRQQSEEETA
ncbi:abc transporter [Phytophthora cinnamomi]|uniref:abc transporter n=1 Tax=Phytophthora cinnamomi TaxID=4785 RepID=UPI003559E885|nr:abc transporter [Phytophthora cinnamomi]